MSGTAMQQWCCLCGVEDVDPQETCPVSAREMHPVPGLRHLIAYGRSAKALAIFERAGEAKPERRS